MLFSKLKQTIFNTSVLLSIIFSQLTFAQTAKLVEVSEWGSQIYRDAVQLGDFYYFGSSNSSSSSKASFDNSSHLDVYDSSIDGREALVGKLSFGREIRSFFKFKEHLVIVDYNSISFYEVNGISDPTLKYELALNWKSNFDRDAFAIKDNTLLYLSTDNTLYIIEHNLEFSLTSSYNIADDFDKSRTSLYVKSIGVEDNKIYISVAFLKEHLFLEYSFVENTISLETTILTTTDEIITQIAYLDNDKFAVNYNRSNVDIFSINSGVLNKVKTIELPSHTYSHIEIINEQIHRIDDIGNLQAFDFNGNEVSSTSIEGDAYFFYSINETPDGFLIITRDELFKVQLVDETYTIDYLFYDAKTHGRPAVVDDVLYLPTQDEIEVIDVNTPTEPYFIKYSQNFQTRPPGNLSAYSGRLYNYYYKTIQWLSIDSEKELYLSGEVEDSTLANLDVIFRDGYLFTKSLRRYDLSTGSSIYNPPLDIDYSIPSSGFREIRLSDSYLITTNTSSTEERGIYIFDNIFSDIKFAKFTPITNNFWYANIYKNIVYIFNNDSRELDIYKITSDGSLLKSNSLTVTSFVESIKFIDDLLLLSYDKTAELYSLESPESPTYISSTYLSNKLSSNQELFVSNGYIYNYHVYPMSIMGINKGAENVSKIFTLDEDSALTINVNEWDPEGDDLSIQIVSPSTNQGLVTFDRENQTLLYTPGTNFFGVETSTLQIEDIHGNTSTIKATFNVSSVNDSPEFIITNILVPSNSEISVSPLAIDSDNDNLVYSINSQAKFGTATLNSDGELLYEPNTDFNGVDTIIVSAADNSGEITQQEITINVTEQELLEDHQIDLDLTSFVANSNFSLSVIDFSDGILTAEVDSSNNVTITPIENHFGSVNINFTANDETTQSINISMTLNIIGVSDLPIAEEVFIEVNSGETYSGQLLAQDIDSENLIFEIIDDGSQNGTIELNQDGSFNYTSTSDFSGEDIFLYQVTDESGGSDKQLLIITVTATEESNNETDENEETDVEEDESSNNSSSGGSLHAFHLIWLLLFCSYRSKRCNRICKGKS